MKWWCLTLVCVMTQIQWDMAQLGRALVCSVDTVFNNKRNEMRRSVFFVVNTYHHFFSNLYLQSSIILFCNINIWYWVKNKNNVTFCQKVCSAPSSFWRTQDFLPKMCQHVTSLNELLDMFLFYALNHSKLSLNM